MRVSSCILLYFAFGLASILESHQELCRRARRLCSGIEKEEGKKQAEAPVHNRNKGGKDDIGETVIGSL